MINQLVSGIIGGRRVLSQVGTRDGASENSWLRPRSLAFRSVLGADANPAAETITARAGCV